MICFVECKEITAKEFLPCSAFPKPLAGSDKDDSRDLMFEGSIGAFITRHVAAGFEFRQQPDNLSFSEQDDWFDAFVGVFLWNLAEDERINHHFAETNLTRFREKLIEQSCQLSGGPSTYSGDDTMKLSHAGMGVGHADFNALVEDLIEAVEAQHIHTGTQNRLLALLAPMHADIIERP